MSLFQSNLRKQIRKLPKFLKSVKIIQRSFNHIFFFQSSPFSQSSFQTDPNSILFNIIQYYSILFNRVLSCDTKRLYTGHCGTRGRHGWSEGGAEDLTAGCSCQNEFIELASINSFSEIGELTPPSPNFKMVVLGSVEAEIRNSKANGKRSPIFVKCT